MEDHNELDDRNSLTSHGSTNADNDKVRSHSCYRILFNSILLSKQVMVCEIQARIVRLFLLHLAYCKKITGVPYERSVFPCKMHLGCQPTH